MSNLLSAEFARLFKSLIFKLGLLVYAGLGVFTVVMRWSDVQMNSDVYAELGPEYSNADGLLFLGGLYLIFVIAVVIGIFVGTEYSDGTIRNKLCAGHTRGSIYLSKLIVCGAAVLILHILYLFVVLVLGNLLIHGTTLKATEILLFTLVSAMAILALTALLMLIVMSIQSKAVGSIVCLLMTMIMLFAALSIWQKLAASEYYDGFSFVNENGEIVEVEPEKNPNYLTGTKREVYEFLNNFLPVSQLYQIVMNESDNLDLIVLYDCVIIIAATGAGIIIFQKKNLK